MISAAASPLHFDLRCSDCSQPAVADASACAGCGGLLEFALSEGARLDSAAWRALLSTRRSSSSHLDRSGVWRFRELLPPIDRAHVVTL
ncbi:MAG: hypothetical protein ACREMT_10140, partial [Vulcanimicrobiaceae bacterium]